MVTRLYHIASKKRRKKKEILHNVNKNECLVKENIATTKEINKMFGPRLLFTDKNMSSLKKHLIKYRNHSTLMLFCIVFTHQY
jgi:hypothetical protein